MPKRKSSIGKAPSSPAISPSVLFFSNVFSRNRTILLETHNTNLLQNNRGEQWPKLKVISISISRERLYVFYLKLTAEDIAARTCQ